MKRGKSNKKLKKKIIFNKKIILVVVIVVMLVAALMFYSLRPKRTLTKEELLDMLKNKSGSLHTIFLAGLVCWCGGADLDHNGYVDMYDFNQFVSYWLMEDCGPKLNAPNPCDNADINHDGIVNFEDYSILANNLGRADCTGGSGDYVGCSSNYPCA